MKSQTLALLITLVVIHVILTAPSIAASAQRPDTETLKLLKQTIAEANSFDDRYDAEVWLVDMSGRLSRYVKNEQERLHILRIAHREATRFKCYR